MSVAEKRFRNAHSIGAALFEMIACLHAVSFVRPIETVLLAITEPVLGQTLATFARTFIRETVVAYRAVVANAFKLSILTSAVLAIVLLKRLLYENDSNLCRKF